MRGNEHTHVEEARESELLAGHALDIRAEGMEFLLDSLVAAIEMVDTKDFSGATRDEPGKYE
jgi:hypothetical protein